MTCPKMVGKYVPISKFTTTTLNQVNDTNTPGSQMTSLGKTNSRLCMSASNTNTGTPGSQIGQPIESRSEVLKTFHFNPSAQIDRTEGTNMNQAQNQVHDQDQDQGHVQDQNPTQSQDPTKMHEQTQEQIQSLPTHTFAEVANFSKGFSPNFHILEHKLEVQPMFLGFKRVMREGYKIPLIQVAAAIGDVVGKQNIDAVQLMKSGWQIYILTEADRLKLMSTRIELAGKSINLQALVRDPNFTPNVKIILKDLPLNEVTNDWVLLALKNLEGIEVQSLVKYSNIFVDGCCTHLLNGD